MVTGPSRRRWSPGAPHNSDTVVQASALVSTALSRFYRGGRWFDSTAAHRTSHVWRTFRAPAWPSNEERVLGARRSVLNLLGLAQRIQRFVDGQEDCRFQRAKRTASTNRQRNRGHGHVVWSLP